MALFVGRGGYRGLSAKCDSVNQSLCTVAGIILGVSWKICERKMRNEEMEGRKSGQWSSIYDGCATVINLTEEAESSTLRHKDVFCNTWLEQHC